MLVEAPQIFSIVAFYRCVSGLSTGMVLFLGVYTPGGLSRCEREREKRREQEAMKFLPIPQTVQSRPISPLSFHGSPLSVFHRKRERTQRWRENRECERKKKISIREKKGERKSERDYANYEMRFKVNITFKREMRILSETCSPYFACFSSSCLLRVSYRYIFMSDASEIGPKRVSSG